MGNFLNPRNDAFRQALNDDIYVDKTMLISCMNKKIGKESSKYVCVSRPRRFAPARRAWLFVDTPKEAKAALYTLIGSIKANSLNQYEYLTYLLAEMPNNQHPKHPKVID